MHCALNDGERFIPFVGCRVAFDTNKGVGAPLCPKCPPVANPINPSTGHKFQEETDYVGTGAYPLVLKRYYNSRGTSLYNRVRLPASYTFFWTGHYSRTLEFSPDASGVATAITAARHDGRLLFFRRAGANYQPEADVADNRLAAFTDASGAVTGWTYYVAATEETESYDSAGRLIAMANRAGLSITFAYDANGALTLATDAFGRQMVFSYDTNRRVTSVTVPGGSVYAFAYDSPDRLISVTYPDKRARLYHYESPWRQALTGITGENGERFATWA